jgi:hypothetical protein
MGTRKGQGAEDVVRLKTIEQGRYLTAKLELAAGIINISYYKTMLGSS